jgi:multiple sugar transport system substrate-binding protein
MAYCYPEHVASYNKSNITVSLDDIIENEQYGFAGTQVKFAGPQQEDFVSGFWAEGCQYEDGKTYTVPFLKSTESLFYNKTFFEEHNLTVPTTWEEMWETCARIKEIDPSSTPLGYDAEANLFITLAETYGYDYTKAEGDYFYFNNEGMRGLMKQFKEYFDKGYFTTGQVSGYYYTSSAFASKTMYMSIGSSAGARYQVSNDGSFETGIASIPKAAGKKQACVSQGPSLVFFRRNNSQEVIASWLFTQYLLRPEAQAKFSFVTGYLPVTKTAMETSYYQEFLSRAYNEDGTLNDINAATSLKAVENYDYYYSSAVFVGSAAARDIVDNLVINILGDRNMTVDNMDTKIKEYFDAAIKECKDQVGL